MIPAELEPIANHMWQSTLFIAAVWLVQFVLRKNRAAVRHRLWLAASFKFLIPLALLTAVGSHFHWSSTSLATSPELSIVVDQFVQPFAAPQPEILPSVPHRSATIDLLGVLLSVWMCGFVASIFWWWMQWLKLYLAKRRGTVLSIGSFPIPIVSCPSRMEPGVFGLFKPALLLPDGIAEKLTAEELQAVLAHEQRHIERRDNLTASIHMLVESLFWFHPLVWWINGRLVEEQERACDEDVLQRGQDPQIYAKSILRICEFYVTSPVMCVSGITGSDLKNRVVAIMTNKAGAKLSFAKKALLAAMGIAAISVPILFGSIHLPGSQAQSFVPTPPLAFEVASIKLNRNPHEVGGRSVSFKDSINHGRLTLDNLGFRAFIAMAYNVPLFQIKGEPGWFDDERFDLIAKAESADASVEEMRTMLQRLLAERCKLAVHREKKELPIYALVVGKSTAKLSLAANEEEEFSVIPVQNGWTFRKAAMSNLATFLSSLIIDIPVQDMTGLTGFYDFTLLRPEKSSVQAETNGGIVATDPGGQLARSTAAASAALEGLGLKLESRKGPVDILVIDHVEMPSENGVSEASSFPDATSSNHMPKTAPVSQIEHSTGILSQISAKPTQAQPQATSPLAFEVASIKPQPWVKNEYAGFGCHGVDGSRGMPFGALGFSRIPIPQGRCVGEFVPLAQVIGFAYGMLANYVVGGPDWVRMPYDTTFEIDAKADDPSTATTDQLRQMLQTLLKDQFKLEVHRGTQELMGYVLTVGKNGTSKLKEASSDSASFSPAGPGLFKGAGTTQNLADMLTQYIGAPIVNKTGLTGKYDIILIIPRVPGADLDSPIPNSVEAQLGLKLERQKVPLETVVIDHVEKPPEGGRKR